MSPANVVMEIALIFTAVSHFLSLVEGMQRPWPGNHHYSNRPAPPTDSYGFPTNWDDKKSPNGYPIYCKTLHKKISIDEQIFPFAPCVFEDDNMDYDDESDDVYSQNYPTQSNHNLNIHNGRNLPIASFNSHSHQGNWHKNSTPKKPFISSFNAPQSSDYPDMKDEIMENENLEFANSFGNTGSTYLQRSGFQVPGEVSQTKNVLANFIDSNDHLSRDKFGLSKDELFRNTDKFLDSQSLEKQKFSGKEVSDELLEEISKEYINNQLDRDRILSFLSSKNKYDVDNNSNFENSYNPSLFTSSNLGKDKNFKYLKTSSINISDGKNSSSVNGTTPKSILKKTNYQESENSPPQFYRYTSNYQNVPSMRSSQVGPSSYHGLQTGSFSINGFGPYNTIKDESSLQELKSIFGMNKTSDKY